MESKWHSLSYQDVEKKLKTNIDNGLTQEEVEQKRKEFGVNELEAKKKKSVFVKFLEQFKDFMIIVLIISAVISGIIGVIEGEGITDSIIIMLVIIVNAIIGVLQENKAEKSLEALTKIK